MEDNSYDSEKGLESLLNDDEDNKAQNNSLANNMGELSELNPPSSINKMASTLQEGTLNKNINMLNDNKIPYPDNEEIPLIKIKNENYLEIDSGSSNTRFGSESNFENGQDIGNYIKSLVKFVDNKFNICSQCKKEENYAFCKRCKKNFCFKCSEICNSKGHTLIILKELFKEIEEDKNNIKLIKSKYILSKEKQNNDGIEKENKDYNEIIDDNKIIEIEEKPMDYTNDIILIDIIIEKNYINYFHYINVQQCLYYIQSKYEGSMTIKYKIKKYQFEIKIFGKNFVENNRNICYIIYEGTKYELREYLENRTYYKILEIKLIGINNIINASHMFYWCESLNLLPDISNWNTNNVTNMSFMFHGCKSLNSLPDISKWNTNNVTDMSGMFYGCESLKFVGEKYFSDFFELWKKKKNNYI